jgi:hypothetical protein
MMSASPISSPHRIPPATNDPTRPRNQTDDAAANAGDGASTTGRTWNWFEDQRPPQSSSYTAPGTGLRVNKLV